MGARSAEAFRAYRVFGAGVGAFLVAAAVLKGYQIAYRGIPATSLHHSVNLYVLQVVAEFLLGVWLTTGLYWKVTRIVAVLGFLGLLNVALWLALTGRRSCGCLGPIDTSPWFAVAADLAILAGLFLFPLEGPERTISAQPISFYAFVLAALCAGVPGLLTITVYRRESPAFSDLLRHDRSLHYASVEVDLQEPSPRDLLRLIATATGVNLSIDDDLADSFSACQPDWKHINHYTVRGWTALEAISKGMPLPSRWIKTADGYKLVADYPLQRARHFWLAGMAVALVVSLDAVTSKKIMKGAIRP